MFRSNPEVRDHREAHPWLTGSLGDPMRRVWFVAENPRLRQAERVRDPAGGPPTEDAQWWASAGDRLFRTLLVRHGLKGGTIEAHGGWRCYITNLIKKAEYAHQWRGSKSERQRAALGVL